MEQDAPFGVRIITAPETISVLGAVPKLDRRGIVFSIRHEFVVEPHPPFSLLTKEYTSLVLQHRIQQRKPYGVMRASLATSFIIYWVRTKIISRDSRITEK